MTQVGPLVHEGQYSLHFLLGQSYLTTGELGKAEDHFIRSANGLCTALCAGVHVHVCCVYVQVCVCVLPCLYIGLYACVCVRACMRACVDVYMCESSLFQRQFFCWSN